MSLIESVPCFRKAPGVGRYRYGVICQYCFIPDAGTSAQKEALLKGFVPSKLLLRQSMTLLRLRSTLSAIISTELQLSLRRRILARVTTWACRVRVLTIDFSRSYSSVESTYGVDFAIFEHLHNLGCIQYNIALLIDIVILFVFYQVQKWNFKFHH